MKAERNRVEPASEPRRAAWPPALALAVGLLLAAGLSGCTASGPAKSSSAAAAGGGVAEPARAASRPSTNDGSGSSTSAPNRSVVRTASVDLRAADVDAVATSITTMAAANGGRVDADQRHMVGRDRTATIIMRVRPDRLDAVLAAVDALGQETDRNVQGEDVTATRADVTARVAALATSVTRLRQLLSRSASVGDLVVLEKQLTGRESDLEAMRARQRTLVDQVDLATVTVNLSVPPAVLAAGRSGIRPTGFPAAVGHGFHAVVIGVQLVLAAVGYALPAAVPVAVVALLVLAWRRRRVAKPAPPQAATPAG